VSRETHLLDPESPEGVGERLLLAPMSDAGPFGWLPRLSLPHIRLEKRLSRWILDGKLPRALRWLEKGMNARVRVEPAEVLWRASGLGRPGMIVQLTAPRLGTRLALGIEIPLAHHVVDRLLGFDRPFAQSRLQITPVEWGIWSFLVLRALDALDVGEADLPDHRGDPGLLGPGDLTLDRVGPDAFDPSRLGSIVTIRWPVHIGKVDGAVRLWLPETVVQLWLASSSVPVATDRPPAKDRRPGEHSSATPDVVPRGELASLWHALAGFVTMPQGLRKLRVGGVLPLSETRLIGSPRSPTGPVDLILDLDDQAVRFRIPTRTVADSGGRLLRLEGRMFPERRTRDPINSTKLTRTPMSQPPVAQNPSATPGVAPLDVPVTLTVELGRINLTVTQLADMKPGDVVELGRHSRAPVEMTSNGRLVARGELVLIDTDLGIRVTNVFL
jgi:flagellar motor switch protein FliN